jgi:hypothetical protein
MRLLRFVMFLFYRYYSKGGTYRIPYFSALSATIFLIYIHIFQLLIIMHRVDWLPMYVSDTRLVKYGKLALLLLPIFFIITFLVKEKDLRNAAYNDDKIRRGGSYLIAYIMSSVILLFVLMFVFAKAS